MMSGLTPLLTSNRGTWICSGLLFFSILWYLQRTRKRTSSNRSSTFDSFLHDAVEPRRAPTDFDNFLKKETTAQTLPQTTFKKTETVPQDAVCIPIFYGTEFGFSKEVAETLAHAVKETSLYWPVVLNMADFRKGVDLQFEQIVVFVCSTQGDGVPPYEAREFCEWLFEDNTTGDLSSTHFSVCALGDKSYAHFCRCGMRIRSAMEKSGAHEFAESVKVDKEDWTVVQGWITSVIDTLPSLDLFISGTNLRDPYPCAGDDSRERHWTKNRPFLAKVMKRVDLCHMSEEHDKRTMHIELDIAGSGMSYLPGDAIGVHPMNRPKDVDELLNAMNIDGEMLIEKPSWAPASQNKNGELDDCVSLREALLRFYDLRSPNVKLFHIIKAQTVSQETRSKSRDMTGMLNGAVVHDSGHSIDDLVQTSHAKDAVQEGRLEELIRDAKERETYLQSRHIIDILSDFKHRPLSVEQMLDSLRPLQPRLYSISSSFLESNASLSMTVAEVRYRAHEKERIGVASTFLTSRVQVGDEIAIYISPNPDFRLPASLTTPILMIGPGTGLAPFRSFVLEKLARAQSDIIGTNLLFFGCRKRDQDYLYGECLEDWNQRGIVQLHVAFSREQGAKVYVQDKLWESAESVWKLIGEGGHIYVCGDAQYMAPDVERCLLRIISTYGKIESGQTLSLLDDMGHSGRYQRDVWF